jgi:hypothetical protein
MGISSSRSGFESKEEVGSAVRDLKYQEIWKAEYVCVGNLEPRLFFADGKVIDRCSKSGVLDSDSFK